MSENPDLSRDGAATHFNGEERSKLRLLVVDDHPSYTAGLKLLLEACADDISVVGTAVSAEAALEQVAEHIPDVVLMDIRMPVREGIEATQKITATWPGVRVMMLTASQDSDDVCESLRAGASGYVCKDTDPEQLLACIRAVHGGEVVISSSLAAPIFRSPGGIPLPLDDGEIRLLKRAAEGLDYSTLADEFAVSESTLKRQIAQVQRKLQVDNRVQAVVKAARKGLI